MSGTSTPEPFNEDPAFDLVTEYPLNITSNDEEHIVMLKFSVTKKETRHIGGYMRVINCDKN